MAVLTQWPRTRRGAGRVVLGQPCGRSERGGQPGRREVRFLEGVVRWRKRRSRSTVAGRLADAPEPSWQPVRSAILAYWEGR